MNIHFCDLCNESVPEGDFSTGKAFLRKGRVICATCEALMSAEEDRVALAASGQRPVLEPLGPEQAGPARAGSPQTAPPWRPPLTWGASASGAPEGGPGSGWSR